jgi:hypothetical protein
MDRWLLTQSCWLSFLLANVVCAEPPETASYTLLPAAQRADVPPWARSGSIRYARCDGGPIEVRKAWLSGWDAIRDRDAVPACETFYNDRTLHMLQDAHLNWVWVTWSNGFAQPTESRQREILGPWIAKCHQAGIRVTAYLSLTNMFIDDMLTKVPASKSWMQIEADGTPRPYTAARYAGKVTRILACLNNPDWLEYSQQRISTAVAAGVDGIFYDNCIHGCKCPLCQRKFADFTTRRFGRSLPVPGVKSSSFQANTQGAEIVQGSSATKRAELAWNEFCARTVAEVLARHRRYADSLRPGIFVYANTHQQPFMTDALNALSTEDGIEPGVVGDQWKTNVGLYKYLYAEGDGWKPARIEHGRRIHGDRMTNPMPPRNEKLSVFEAAACQAGFESFFEMGWTTQLYRGDKSAENALAALAEANAWLDRNAALFADVEPIARTALVMPKADRATNFLQAGKNFIVLMPKQLTPVQLRQFPLVVLDNVRFLTARQRSAVVDYVRSGGHLLATGETASFDTDSLLPTHPPGLPELFQDGPSHKHRVEIHMGQGVAVYDPQSSGTAPVLRDWTDLEGAPLATVHATSGTLAFNLVRTWNGRRIRLFLLNYAEGPARDVEVMLHLPLTPSSLRLYAPAAKPSSINSRPAPGGLSLRIAQMDQLSVVEGTLMVSP